MDYGLSKWFFFFLFWLSFSNLSQAEVVPDDTLPQNSTVNSDCATSCQIDGGTIKDKNLFHSFEEFSVPADVEIIFNNSPNIENIFTRVTGSLPSEIDGTISAQDSANLFLINPNGIMFGANAQLDIGGSFLATTADSIFFADGSQFSATNSQSSSLLTVSVPIGLQFGSKVGNIHNQSRRLDSNRVPIGLEVGAEKTLALLGGEIFVNGGVLTAPSGKVELGSVSANSFVGLHSNLDGLFFSYQNVENFHDISLSNKARIIVRDTNTAFGKSGDVRAIGRRIELKDQSIISSLNSSNQNGGSVFIEGEQLVIQDGSRIRLSTDGNGRAGNIVINADQVELFGTDIEQTGFTGLSSRSLPSFFSSSVGSAGKISIDTKQLTIRGGAQISVTTFNMGQGGNLKINASESVKLIGRLADGKAASGLFAQSVGGKAKGNAGDLQINTGKLIVQDGGKISVGTIEDQINLLTLGVSEGNGGELVINATESIEVSGFGFDEQGEIAPSTLLSESQGTGDAGNLAIATPKLTVTNQGEINVSATGTGEAGSLNIDARDITLERRGTLTAETNAGNQGNITITNADTLLLRNNSAITTNAQQEATGGGY